MILSDVGGECARDGDLAVCRKDAIARGAHFFAIAIGKVRSGDLGAHNSV